MGKSEDKKKKNMPEENRNSFFPGKDFYKSRKFMIILSCLILLLALAFIGFIGIYLPMQMFSKNPRFTLSNVKIVAHPRGYWLDKKEKICQIMKVKIGSDNLFAFNLRDLAERLLARPSIESVSVRRVLPDTLLVKISEREPRALLQSVQSPFVVDNGGNLMLRTECMNIASILPVISGIKKLASLKAGERVPGIKNAMELLQCVKTKWPDIRIERIYIREKKLFCIVKYKTFPDQFLVEMPEENISLKVRELATALDRIVNTASKKRKINLMYENRAVLSDLPERR